MTPYFDSASSSRLRGRPARRAAQAGFTLVELLVTLLLASIVVLVFYGFLTVASNATWTQADALRATERLEIAMSTVTSDIRTAGHLGVPNYNLGPDDYRGELVICGSAVGGLANANSPTAFELANSALASRAFTTNAVDLQLTGAFEIQESMLVLGTTPDSIEVRLPPSFAPRGVSVANLGTWQDAFRERWARAIRGSALLITNSRGGAVLVATGDPDSLPGNLLYDPIAGTAALPVAAGALTLVGEAARFSGATSERAFSEVCRFTDALLTGEGVNVSVINRVRYRRITARAAGLVAETGATLGDPDEPVLIRETIAFGAPATPAAGDVLDAVLVARNITDFQVFVDGVTESEIAVSNFAEPERSPAADTSPFAPGRWGNLRGAATRPRAQRDAAGNSCVHHARHVYVQMSAAFDRPGPGLAASPAADVLNSVVPARWAESTPTQFSRVLTTRAEVSLSNFAFADLRGGSGC